MIQNILNRLIINIPALIIILSLKISCFTLSAKENPDNYIKSQINFFDNIVSISYAVTPIGCAGNDGAIDITVTSGTAPYSFIWSNYATSEDLSGIANPGTYDVTVSDATGINSITTISVDYNPATLSLTYQLSINGCSGTIDLSAQNGTMPYSYIWSDGSTTQDIINQLAGIYQVTVTDGTGCTRIKQAVIALPQMYTEIVPTDITNCTNPSNGAADLSITGGITPYNYLWSNGITSQNMQNLTQGIYYITVTDFCGTATTDSASIDSPMSFVFSYITDNPSCGNNYSGSVSVNVDYATLPISYYWSNQASTELVTGLQNGQYSLTVTDVYGCTGTFSIIIAGLSQPLINIDVSDTMICSGDPVAVSASASQISTYTITQEFITETSSGSSVDMPSDDYVYGPFNIGFSFNYWGNSYSHFYIASNGWIGFKTGTGGQVADDFIISPVPPASYFTPFNSILGCWRDWNPNTGQVKYASNGFAPNRKLIINYINVALDSCSTLHGTFQIVLYEGTNNIRINLTSVPACTNWNNGYGVMGLMNYNGSQAVTIPALNCTPFTAYNTGYLFSPVYHTLYFQNGDSIINNQEVTHYPSASGNLILIDSSYCSITEDSIHISVTSAPGLSAGNDTSICQNSSLSLMASPGYDAYSWSTGANSQSIIVSPVISQTYTVTGHINACIDTAYVVVTVIPVPALYLGPDQQICMGDTAIIDVYPLLGFDTYLWSTGETVNSILVAPETDQNISLIASNLCITDTDYIDIIVSDYHYFNLGNDTTLCGGGPFLLNAGPGFTSYYWSTGATSQSINASPLAETEYTVFAHGACNNIWDTIIIVPIFIPVADFYYDAASGTFNNLAQDFTSCTWNFGDGSPLSHDANPVHFYSQSGAYYVYLYVENECGHDFEIYRIEYTGINEGTLPEFIIYPNPVKDFLYLQLPGIAASVEITDITGKGIIAKEISGTTFSLDLSCLAPGIYMVKVVCNKDIFIRKIIRD